MIEFSLSRYPKVALLNEHDIFDHIGGHCTAGGSEQVTSMPRHHRELVRWRFSLLVRQVPERVATQQHNYPYR